MIGSLVKIMCVPAFLFLLACPVVLSAQQKTDSVQTYSKYIGTKVDTAWNNLYDVWRSNFFYDCLSKSNIHIRCAQCDGVFMLIDFQINDKGFITNYRIVDQDMCGDDFTEKLLNCFLMYFLTIDFPKELRNMILEVHLGTSLKC
ncbi:MAG: hypothetical protein WCQ95_03070 [Bacteroidota bacterium]